LQHLLPIRGANQGVAAVETGGKRQSAGLSQLVIQVLAPKQKKTNTKKVLVFFWQGH